MASVGQARATLEDLYRTPGKAELIGGRIVHLMATGYKPNRVAGRIFRSLDDYAEKTGRGVAFTDNMGFAGRSRRPNCGKERRGRKSCRLCVSA